MRVKDIEHLDKVIREEPDLLCFRFTDDKKELPLREYEKLIKKNLRSVDYTSTPFGIYAFPYKYFFKEPPGSLEEFFEVMAREGVEVVDYSDSDEEGAKHRLLFLSKGGVLYYNHAKFVRFMKIKRGTKVWVIGENDPNIDYKKALSFTLGLIKSYIPGVDSRRINSLRFFVKSVFKPDRGYFPLFPLSSIDSILFRSLADVYEASSLYPKSKLLPFEEILFGMLLGEKKWIREVSKVVYTLLSSELAKTIDREFFNKSRELGIDDGKGGKYIDLPMITLVFSLGLRSQVLFLNRSFLSANEESLRKQLYRHSGLDNLSKLFYHRAYEKVRKYLDGVDKWGEEEYAKNRDRLAYAAAKYLSLSIFSLVQRMSKDFTEEVDTLLSQVSANKQVFSKESYDRILESIHQLDLLFYMLFLSLESLVNPVFLFPFYSYEEFISTFFEKSQLFSSIYSTRENRKKVMELYTHMAGLGRRGVLDKISEDFSRLVESLDRRYSGISKMMLFKYFQLDDSKINKTSNYKKTKFISDFITSLGFDAVIDPGYGMIHPNEPVQMVILNEEVIEKSIVIENIYYSYFKALRTLRKTTKKVLGLIGKEAETENMREYDLYRLVYRYLKGEVLSQETMHHLLGLSPPLISRERILHGLILLSQDLKEMERIHDKLGLKDKEASKLIPVLLKAIDEVVKELAGKKAERLVRKAIRLSRVRGLEKTAYRYASN
jgi:hypothetical protein